MAQSLLRLWGVLLLGPGLDVEGLHMTRGTQLKASPTEANKKKLVVHNEVRPSQHMGRNRRSNLSRLPSNASA